MVTIGLQFYSTRRDEEGSDVCIYDIHPSNLASMRKSGYDALDCRAAAMTYCRRNATSML